MIDVSKANFLLSYYSFPNLATLDSSLMSLLISLAALLWKVKPGIFSHLYAF